MNKEIINFVENNSWFEWEEGNDMFATRENGTMGDREEYGEKDFDEAIRIKKLLKEKFPNQLVTIETCDEWVMIMLDYDET